MELKSENAFTLEPSKVSDLIYRVTVRITQQVAKLDLQISYNEPDPAGDVCSVYTTITGPYHTTLVLCAERHFLQRMTENMMEAPLTDMEDLEEYSKEFFNVLCGHIVGEIFRLTKAGASFHPPCFIYGRYSPEMPEDGPEALICFTSDQSERVVVLHDEIKV